MLIIAPLSFLFNEILISSFPSFFFPSFLQRPSKNPVAMMHVPSLSGFDMTRNTGVKAQLIHSTVSFSSVKPGIHPCGSGT